jgi:serine/threonine protein phosphatase 1
LQDQERERRLTVAVGDIHGRADLLAPLLQDIVQRWGERLQAIVVVGDLIDRGPDSAGVVRALRELEGALPGKVHCLRGNHEQMLLSCLEAPGLVQEWLQFGGMETLDSFRVQSPSAIPEDVIAWLRGLPTQWEDPLRCYVHAGLQPGLRLRSQKDQHRLWIREPFLSSGFDFGKHVVHGHSTVETIGGRRPFPDIRQFRTNLDTGAFHTGVLSAAVFDDQQPGPIGVMQALDGGIVYWMRGPFDEPDQEGTPVRRKLVASLVAAGLITAAGMALLGRAPDTGTVAEIQTVSASPVPASSAPAQPSGARQQTAAAMDPLAEALLPWSGPRPGSRKDQPTSPVVQSESVHADSPGAVAVLPAPQAPAAPAVPQEQAGREPTFAAIDPAPVVIPGKPEMADPDQTAGISPADDTTGSVPPVEQQASMPAPVAPVAHPALVAGADQLPPEALAALTPSPPAPVVADSQEPAVPQAGAPPDAAADAVVARLDALTDLVPPVEDPIAIEPPATAAAVAAPISGSGSAGNNDVEAAIGPEPGQAGAVPDALARLADQVPSVEGLAGLDPPAVAPVHPRAEEKTPAQMAGLESPINDPAEDQARLALARLVDLVPPVNGLHGLETDQRVQPVPAEALDPGAVVAMPVARPAGTSSRPEPGSPSPSITQAKAPRTATRAPRRPPAAYAASRPDKSFIAALSRLFRADGPGRRMAAARSAECVTVRGSRKLCGPAASHSRRDAIAEVFGLTESGDGSGGYTGRAPGFGIGGAGGAASGGSDGGAGQGNSDGNGRGKGNGGGNGRGNGGGGNGGGNGKGRS